MTAPTACTGPRNVILQMEAHKNPNLDVDNHNHEETRYRRSDGMTELPEQVQASRKRKEKENRPYQLGL
jgi:hypothetical protein